MDSALFMVSGAVALGTGYATGVQCIWNGFDGSRPVSLVLSKELVRGECAVLIKRLFDEFRLFRKRLCTASLLEYLSEDLTRTGMTLRNADTVWLAALSAKQIDDLLGKQIAKSIRLPFDGAPETVVRKLELDTTRRALAGERDPDPVNANAWSLIKDLPIEQGVTIAEAAPGLHKDPQRGRRGRPKGIGAIDDEARVEELARRVAVGEPIEAASMDIAARVASEELGVTSESDLDGAYLEKLERRKESHAARIQKKYREMYRVTVVGAKIGPGNSC